jgi:branched-chain amino acid transport system permease protein
MIGVTQCKDRKKSIEGGYVMHVDTHKRGIPLEFGINKSELLALLAGVLAVVLIPLIFTSSYVINLFILAAAMGIAALGLTVVLGYTGQLSLAQSVFFAIGSYFIGLGTTRWNMNWWVALLLGLIFATIIGLFLGFTTLKVGGRYLAMVTICLQIVFALILANWVQVTNGADGVGGILRPMFIFRLDTAQKYAWFAFTILLIVAIFVWKLKSSKLGRAMRAVRDNEMAAEALGIDSLRVKVTAFVICAVLGALGGSIYASGFLYISPDSFTYANSVDLLAMALLGGRESAAGTILGALVLTMIPEMLRDFKELYLVIYGLIIVLATIFLPGGISSIVALFIRRYVKPTKLPPASMSMEVKVSTTEEVLVAENVGKHFGGLKALDGVSLVVHKGEFYSLIGPNGSGKTTFINVISGVYVPTFGKITFLGQDITGVKSNRIAKLGLNRTFQNLRLFRELTVWENVLVGSQREGGTEKEIWNRAMSAIEFVGLGDLAHELCKNLPYGHQKYVELARALAGKPQLLMLDEPAAGLNESEKEDLVKLLKRINEKGLTIFLVEHDMSVVTQLSNKITVLNFGQKIAEGEVETVLNDPVVVEAYLGNMEVVIDA